MFLVFSLCVSAFAADDLILVGDDFDTFGNLSVSDYGVQSADFSVSVTAVTYSSQYVSSGNNTFVCSSSDASSFVVPDGSSQIRYTSGTANMGEGSLSVNLPVFASGMVATTSAAGASITMTSSGFVIVSDGSTSPIPISFNSVRADVSGGSTISMSASYSGSPYVPSDPYEGSGSMYGWTGETLLTLSLTENLKWFSDGSGSSRIGFGAATWDSIDGEASGIRGDIVNTQMLASLTRDKWKWEIDAQTGQIKWGMSDDVKGSWADMIYRTSVYNWYWGNKLWNNDVSGSWYGSISNSFSYLNYRVNQILDVLANDEDVKIKDATTDLRDWVANDFTNGSTKPSTDDFDDLTNIKSGFVDLFNPEVNPGSVGELPDQVNSMISDPDDGFWTQNTVNNLGLGNSSSGARAPMNPNSPDYVPDFYSEWLNELEALKHD